MTKSTPPAKPEKPVKVANTDRKFNVPDGANECSIHYCLSFCDCPRGT
jgi:hypothetical protein